MARRYYHKNSSYGWLWKFLFAAAVVYGIYWTYDRYFVFHAETILANSIVKEKDFTTEIVEVVSPQKKIKAYLFQDTTNPIISINFLFKNAGLASDGDKEVGISNMVSALLRDGAGDLNSQQFKEALETKAISISFSADMDDISGSLLTIKDNAEEAYRLLNMVLTQPRFEAEDIERVKAQMLNVLKRQREHPSSVLELEAAKEIFGAHPYARNQVGEAEDIARVDKLMLDDFVKNHLTKNNLMVGIAGDVSPEEAGKLVDKIFGNIPDTGRIIFVRGADVNFDGREKNINLQSPQTVSVFANKAIARTHPDFYPLYIANHIFGGSGLNSRLSLSAREKEGLTYGIYTYMSLSDKAPMLKGGFSATPENFAKVVGIVKKEWLKMGTKGVKEKELKDAKNYLISSYNLRFASIATISEILVYMQKDDLGLDFLQKRNDYVRKVKLKDVNRVAKEYFQNINLVFVNVGSFGKN